MMRHRNGACAYRSATGGTEHGAEGVGGGVQVPEAGL